jgi:hypothetical protein
MITVGYSTRQSNPHFQEYLKKTCGYPKVEIIEKVNPNGRSLTEVYNEILSESKSDIVVLCHDDIYFEKNGWGNYILNHFKRTEYGILGVAGSTHIPKSGMWWEDRRRMVGIVNHEHEGKKWESKYSPSLGKEISPTIIVDGLFLVIHKQRIKHNFDETVKGFHMYDVNFCFRNYLDGVKVGVMFDIRITHKSIGMTNDEWEKNRISFSEKFENSLPQKIAKTTKDKLNILLSCLNFKTFTGSEVYVYELTKNLIKRGHNVTVLSEIGGPLTEMAKKLGIKVFSFQEPPGFKRGDGVWSVQTPNGMQKSQEGMLYKITDTKFDIIHVQHEPVTNLVLQLFPTEEKIATIHSEVIELEKPVLNDTIKKYVAIRPEIKSHIIESYEIPENKIDVIYNPVDEVRFKPSNKKDKNYLLFVGTIDYLRENAIRDLIEYTKEQSLELWLVGEKKSEYLDEIKQIPHVKWFPPTWNTERYISEAKETAGILLGRTTIESWMSGKSSWIYQVDNSGFILSKELFEPPSDLNKFSSSIVTDKIIENYLSIINETSN